jgi:hypothetical protein
MKTNFVLENFDDYLTKVYSPVNEAKVEPLTGNEAREIINSLLKSQKRSSMSSTKIKALVESVFGKEISQRISKSDGYWADEREGIANNPQEEEDKKKAEFFEKIKEFDQALANANLGQSREDNENYRSSVIMGLFHQFMTKNSKDELIKAFAERATELKLTADKINKQIAAKGTSAETAGQPPAVLGYVSSEDVERVKVIPPVKSGPTPLLDPIEQKTLFLDNSWDLNPKVGSILRERLSSVLERRKQGAYSEILELSIKSSASRYRNTKAAENLSWGQLAFKRSMVIHGMIGTILDELEIPIGDPIREELNKVATMSIGGINGDGTSGPNPLPDPTLGNLRVGYYQTTTKQTKDQTGASKFVDENKDENTKVYIVKIDQLGNTVSEPTVKDMPVLKTKEAYDEFKFVNVVVRYSEFMNPEEAKPSIRIDKVPEGTIAPEIVLEKKGKKGDGGGWSFRWPKLPKLGLGKFFAALGDDICLVCHCGDF